MKGRRRALTIVGVMLLAVMLLAVLGGCGGTTSMAPVIVRIDESRAGSIVRVAPSYIVELILKGNASTGFAWKNLTFDSKTLTLLAKEPTFVADSSATGAPGTYTWKFEAIALGGGSLRIDYVAPNGTVDSTFTVDIMVEPGK